VRDLVETSIRIVKAEKVEKLKEKAEKLADERIVAILVPNNEQLKAQKNPFEMLFSGQNQTNKTDVDVDPSVQVQRNGVRERLAKGELENDIIEIEVEDNAPSMMDMLAGQGNEQIGVNIQEMLGSMIPKKTKKRKLPIKEARKVLSQEEAHRLMDQDEMIQEAIKRAEQTGIIFIDEIDKVASPGKANGPDVSREGVQRDILPIVEGSTIVTKYGPVKTDFVLFIAAGAFHLSKPSDLIPELQGRFPVRVELNSLTHQDFVRILQEPKNALTKQYTALLETEGINIDFSAAAIDEIARIAVEVNQNTENIGARRLHTILEKLLEDLSFEASEITLEHLTITPEYVKEKLADISQNRDLSQYIL
jgi:ATP-dependent HslUV protease ATP-binding subunit HslU